MTELPTGWELRRLSDCLETLKSGKKAERGWSPQCLSYPSKNEDAWGVLKTTSVQMGEFQPEYNKELPESLEPKSGLEVNEGDFLVTTTGPRNRCGIVCHVKKTRKKLIFSGKILRLRVHESVILPNWLMYLLMSPEYQSTLDKMKVGTSDSSVSIGNQQILDLEIPVPPIEEQHKIVALLEEHLSRLDAALADVKQAKIKAAQFRRSLLQAAFTGNLALNESNLKTEIPGEWRQERFGDIFKVKYGKAIDKSLRMEFAEFPVVGSAGIMTYTKTPLTSEPTIVIGRKGNVGSIQIFKEGCYPIDTTYYMPTISDFDIDFLTYQLTSLELVKLDSSTATPSLRREDLENVQVVIPPIEEQLKIVALIENHLFKLESAVESADAMEKQSTGLKRSLLQAAFSGQLTKEVASV
jgi:restriction endonuclease S subunit